MEWNDNTMLALATEFITEEHLGDKFFAWCNRHAMDSAITPDDNGEPGDEVCRTCGVSYDGCGDGYDGECPGCADKTEVSRRASEENPPTKS